MLFKKYLVVVPGIILAFVVYTLSQGLNNIIGIEILGYAKSPISTAMIAILMGIVLGNIFQMRERFLIGINFTQKYILKLQSYGVSLIITDHQVQNLFDIVDRAYVLGEQSIIAQGTPSEILKSSKAIELYFGSSFRA